MSPSQITIYNSELRQKAAAKNTEHNWGNIQYKNRTEQKKFHCGFRRIKSFSMHKIEKFCVAECREIHRLTHRKRNNDDQWIQNHLKYLICISCWICMWPWPMATKVKMFLIQVSIILWIQTIFWSVLSTYWYIVFNAWFYHTFSCNHNIQCFTICYA